MRIGVYIESNAHVDADDLWEVNTNTSATSRKVFIPLTTSDGDATSAKELQRAICAAAQELGVTPYELCRAIEVMTSKQACNLVPLSSLVYRAT